MKAVAFAALALALVISCAQERESSQSRVTETAEPTDVIDQDLMIALSQAKNYHHKARIYMSDGNTPAAIASVREILSLKFPAGAPEAEDVLDDARALLAKLLVGQGQLDEATKVVDDRLAHRQRDSFFIANLYTVQGEIHQARAEQLSAGGNATGAAEEKRAAISSFDASIEIEKKLQQGAR